MISEGNNTAHYEPNKIATGQNQLNTAFDKLKYAESSINECNNSLDNKIKNRMCINISNYAADVNSYCITIKNINNSISGITHEYNTLMSQLTKNNLFEPASYSSFNQSFKALSTVETLHKLGSNKNFYSEKALENFCLLSQNATESKNLVSVDLSKTNYQNIASFNQHIQSNIYAAGFGSRQGVTAAGISLIGDYITATGHRLRYNQNEPYFSEIAGNTIAPRQAIETTGIANENFSLDCSSFAWWALYNGGYKIPTNNSGQEYNAYTGDQIQFAEDYGISKKCDDNGKAGDFLVHHNTSTGSGHIMMILGGYDGGYYVAEESNWGEGAKIDKKSYDELKSKDFVLMDMDNYYNDQNNIRKK